MASLTANLGSFVSQLTLDRIPQDLRTVVCAGFVDTVGVMMAGAKEPAVTRLLSTLPDTSADNSGARLLLTARRLPSEEAALVGATAAHALDYDDVALSSHPSAVLVPALLAEGEIAGASGGDLIVAYAAGFEVWAELFRRSRDYHRKGWHPTAVFGPVATAAAIASLRRLPAEQTTQALAIAASMTGGLVANFGTMTKPLHAGLAAQNGIRAVRLALSGFTAAADALEHPQGFLVAISPDGKPDLAPEIQAGNPWALATRGLNVKRYPTCYATHRSIDAMIDLANERDLRPDDIVGIEVRMGRVQAAALRNPRPVSGLEAKFSEEFAMACAIVHRDVGLAQLTDAVVEEPELRGLFSKVNTTLTDEQDPDDPVFSPTEDVIVRLANGDTIEKRDIRYAYGHARNPLTPGKLRTKYNDCMAASGVAEAAQIHNALGNLERLSAVSAIPTASLSL